MPNPIPEPQTQKSYVVLELSAPVVITLVTSDVFETSEYRLTDKMVTARGKFRGGGVKISTVLFPLTAVASIDFVATEIPKNAVPANHQASVQFQVDQIEKTPTTTAG